MLTMMLLNMMLIILLPSAISYFGSLFLLMFYVNVMVKVSFVTWTFTALAMFLMLMCLLGTYGNMMKNYTFYVCLLYLILLPLMVIFKTDNLLTFYLFYEMVLLPMVVLMFIWGASQEKMKAAYYFFFYTLMSSLLMFLSIVHLFSYCGTLEINQMLAMELPWKTQVLCFLSFSASFMVKMPLIPFHMWLPQAHVEAPMAGSILLAGMLLKLGVYGFLVIVSPLFPDASEYFSPIMLTLGLISVFYGGMITISQSDLKSLMAYSSVSHMGLMIVIMFLPNFSVENYESAVLISLSHGMTSPCMFVIASVLYESIGSSIISYYKGMIQVMPLFSGVSFLLMSANMGFPVFLNFIGEYIAIKTIVNYNVYIAILVSSGMMACLVYSLHMYHRMFLGTTTLYTSNLSDLASSEAFMFLMSISLLLMGGLGAEFIFFSNLNCNLMLM